MTVRESIHKLVDILPEDRLSSARDYLEELSDDAEITPATKAAVEEGLADIRAGRTISLEELRSKHQL
jgi:predicted transcriptional regulator